jgi:hypothetical protein
MYEKKLGKVDQLKFNRLIINQLKLFFLFLSKFRYMSTNRVKY